MLFAFFLVMYTYIIFPLLLFALAAIKTMVSKDSEKTPNYTEDHFSIAVICAMYNEEKVVREKIENFLRINYDDITLHIGSDGSTDATNEVLREYSGNAKIKTYEFPRRGKVYVINDLMTKADADILVFTDANSMFESDAIINLIKQFHNPGIGAVCGRLKLLDQGKITGEGFYWRYETKIKLKESILNCVIGANGAIYAVRKKLLRPLPVDTINDDFTNSMRVAEQGYGIKYAEDAVAYENASHDDSVEFKRHIRDAAGHYRAIVHLYKLLNPFRPKVFFLYVSHRVIRWLVPFLLVALLVIPPFAMGERSIKILFSGEVLFYIFAMIGWRSKTKMKLFYIPYYFIYINLALLIGFFRNIFGVQDVIWDRTER